MVSARCRPGPLAPARSGPVRSPPRRGPSASVFRRGGAASAGRLRHGRGPLPAHLPVAGGGGRREEPPGAAAAAAERRGARGAGRAPRHAAHGGHQPDGPAAAAEGDRAGAGRLHGPHLAQLLRRVQRSPGEQHRGRGPEGRSRREGLRGGGRSVPPVSPPGGISLSRALLWPSPARGCSRHPRALLFLLPPSSWWMPPTPPRSPRPASSCSRSSPQRRSPLCPSWCFSTRCEEDVTRRAGVPGTGLCFAALPRLESPELGLVRTGVPRAWLMLQLPSPPCSDLPCYMSLVEMKSLFRMQDIVSCATQPITMLETSARDGTGLAEVLQWLRSALKEAC